MIVGYLPTGYLLGLALRLGTPALMFAPLLQAMMLDQMAKQKAAAHG
jgi:hypothetical protein